jgi:hypothetical protein
MEEEQIRSVFKDIAIKVMTDTGVKDPELCFNNLLTTSNFSLYDYTILWLIFSKIPNVSDLLEILLKRMKTMSRNRIIQGFGGLAMSN